MMNRIKQFLSKYAEYYLVILILLTGYSPKLLISPVAIVVAALVVLQIIIKNRITGVFLAILFLVVNGYMFFAMISEFNEFPLVNIASLQLLLFGLLLISVNVTIGVLMMMKYTQPEKSSALNY